MTLDLAPTHLQDQLAPMACRAGECAMTHEVMRWIQKVYDHPNKHDSITPHKISNLNVYPGQSNSHKLHDDFIFFTLRLTSASMCQKLDFLAVQNCPCQSMHWLHFVRQIAKMPRSLLHDLCSGLALHS